MKADKVWNQIESLHGGNVHDSDWGSRMRGEGVLAMSIKNLFDISKKKYMKDKKLEKLNVNIFRRNGNLNLFD